METNVIEVYYTLGPRIGPNSVILAIYRIFLNKRSRPKTKTHKGGFVNTHPDPKREKVPGAHLYVEPNTSNISCQIDPLIHYITLEGTLNGFPVIPYHLYTPNKSQKPFLLQTIG